MNTNVLDHHEQHSHEHLKQGKQKLLKKFQSYYHKYLKLLDDISEAEQLARPNCTSGKKENQRYSSSFIGNVTKRSGASIVDKEFKDIIGKAKTISSVHEDEDITLCWIETTTIKENKTVQPPRRLVIREYTISFENSATIPDKYLECKKLEGELTPNDKEINKTALFEVIDEDTKVSRVVNFTSVSHVGDVIVWQYKKVKCGVGPVVSKNIVEWNDGSKKPKKRVEIKVSPKLQKLTATKAEEEEPCTESSAEDENENSNDVTTEFCKNMNGACEVTTKSEDILIKSTTEISISEEVTKSKEEAGSESEEDLNLSTGVTKPSILLGEKIFTSTVEPITNEEIVSCENDSSDPSCTTQKNIMHSSSLEEIFTEAGATTEISSIHQEIVTEKDIFDKEKLPQFSSSSQKEKEVSDLIIDESTLLPSTTDILIKSSVTTPKNIDYTVSTSETNITTSHGATKDEEEEENLTSTDNSKDTSTELTSEELTEIDHVPSLSTINGEQEVTTKVSSHEITEFVKESETFTEILNKLSSISTESIPESVTSQSTLEEVLFQGTTTTSSSTKIKSTASSEVDYSCENSEDCAYISSSESCDEFGNCGSVTSSSCESGICSEEETEDQSKPDTVFLPTKNQSFVTESQSSEQLATVEIQHTTVASVPTTVIAQDTEQNNSTMINMDTRRSTTTSKPQHTLSLKVKILLEHIDEKKEKHNLVEVEKHVSFDENSIQENHSDLLEQLRALNESVNNETLSALLSCNGPIRARLGNFIENTNINTNINNMQSNDVIDKSHKKLKYTDFSAIQDLISERFTSERALAKNNDFQYPEHDQENDQENEALYRRRSRRSLDDKKGDLHELDIVTKSSIDPDELSVTTNSLNVSEQTTSLTETTHPSTTTNNPEEGTSDVTENERNTTTEENDGVTFSTIKDNDTDSTTSEYQDVNVTKESVQLSTTTNNPQEETNDTVRTESGNDTTTEIVLSIMPLVNENIANGTKIVVQVLPEIQKDVSTGLTHVITKLMQNNLTSVNDINKKIKTNVLLSIIANPKDNRVHSRIRRAAAEEVGHWSNERIREMSMGGSLRTFTEFTLYKVLS